MCKVFYIKLQNSEGSEINDSDNQSQRKVLGESISVADHYLNITYLCFPLFSTVIASPLPVLAQSSWLLSKKRSLLGWRVLLR